MEENSKPSTIRTGLTRLLILLVAFECSALVSMLVTHDSVQLQRIKSQVQTLLNDQSGTEHLQSVRSWRLGPYQHTQLEFYRNPDRKVVVHASHWWGFNPEITCLSNGTEDHCQ